MKTNDLPYTVRTPAGQVIARLADASDARGVLSHYSGEARTLERDGKTLWTEGRDADGCANYNDGGATFDAVVSTRESGVPCNLDRRGARTWAAALLGHNAVVSGDPRRKGAAQARVGVALVGGGLEIYGSSDVDWTSACLDALKTLDQKRASRTTGGAA